MIVGQHRRDYLRVPVRGFTLVELMIVLAIIAIIAAIAYPAYTDSVRKGRRAEARTALLSLMQQQERLLTQNGSYMAFGYAATGGNGTVYRGGADVAGQTIPFLSRSGANAYDLRAVKCAGLELNACVTLEARPVATDPAAGNLTFSSTGAKSCTGTNQAVCWK